MKLFQTEYDIKTRSAVDKYNAVEEYKKAEAAKVRPYTDETEALRHECTVGFNFIDANVRVFSVERVNWGNADQEKTLVGYYFVKDAEANTMPTIKEWSLYCSRKTHNEAVKLFASSPQPAPTPVKQNKKLLKG